jgi:NAD(P)H-dependent FMN reductase
MIKIKILTGSSRPGRFNIQPSNWIHEIAKKRSDISVELIDVQDLNLPFLDEPVPPLMHQYSQDHTKKWAERIADGDGFIFVTPEYNHSMSAVLKNAIDYLNLEWNFKPVTFVSYGSVAGGARAVEHLRGVAGELKMFDLRDQVLLPNYWENMDEKGQYKFTEAQEKIANDMLDTLIFWAQNMKDGRQKMAAQ